MSGPLEVQIKRVQPEDNDPLFQDIALLDDGYVYFLPRKELFKTVLEELVKSKGLSLEAAVRTLMEERLAGQVIPEKPRAAPKPPKAPDPPELAANCVHNHVVGRAIAAGGRKARKTAGSWYDNTVDGRPVYRYEHNGRVVTVYLEPQDYNALELWVYPKKGT